MLDAKDTFYITLRDRLALVNPDRRMLTRGALRPSVLVEEAEPVTGKVCTGRVPDPLEGIET